MATSSEDRRTGGGQAPLEPAVAVARYRHLDTWAHTARWFLVGLLLIGLVLACYPITVALAGKQTTLNVSLVASVSVAATFAASGLGVWGWRQKRRSERLNQRNGELQRDVRELQARLQEAGLPTQVSR